jgi:glyoxylase-like metal-dependent hydrolase (beta-lactamase superfamily II)
MLVVRRLRSPAALLAFSVFNNHKNIVAWTPTAFANFALGAAAAATTATESSTGRLFSSSAMSSADGTCAAKSESKFTVVQFPCLGDNYGYLIHDEATKHTAAIDTPDAKAYQDELAKRGWRLTHILNTHHHWDHTGGNLDLKTEGVSVYGPATEDIPGVDVGLKGEDEIEFGSSKARIIDVGGHTKGHIAYYFGDESKVFVGDSLFALGCGKMFEGTPAQFWASLLRLRDLPDDTLVYW